MTLLDAPKFDAEKTRRRLFMGYGFLGGFVFLFVLTWFVVGHPLEAPWNWYTYWQGQRAVDRFLHTVESNDLKAAYAIWVNDPNWLKSTPAESSHSTHPKHRCCMLAQPLLK